VITSFGRSDVTVQPPSGVRFPFGQFGFTATSTPGALVTFTLTLPSPVTDFYKLISGSWQRFTFDGETGARVTGTSIAITIRDNGRGDSNPALGLITDPGAPAVSQAPPPGATAPPTITSVPASIPSTGSSTMSLLAAALATLSVGLFVHVAVRRRPIAG
jgi:hypothetical protein